MGEAQENGRETQKTHGVKEKHSKIKGTKEWGRFKLCLPHESWGKQTARVTQSVQRRGRPSCAPPSALARANALRLQMPSWRWRPPPRAAPSAGEQTPCACGAERLGF